MRGQSIAQRSVGLAARQLQFPIPDKPNQMRYVEGTGSGIPGRMFYLRRCVTALYKHERVEMPYDAALEVRQYAERLLQESIIRGREDAATVELADFWLNEKEIVHKLFNVLVPRYSASDISYTVMHRLPEPQNRPGVHGAPRKYSVLELRHNPWPPITHNQATHDEKSRWLINVLVNAAKSDFVRRKSFHQTASSSEDSPVK